MTNKSDLNECSAQIKLLKQLVTTPKDLKEVLTALETKKALLMRFRERSYATILEGLESGILVLEEKKVEIPEEPKIDRREIVLVAARKAGKLRLEAEAKAKKKAEKLKKEAEEKTRLEKELQDAKDRLVELEALRELEKEEEAEIIAGETADNQP